MFGGLFKSAGVASLAAAGLLMGGVSAHAADLGGNCCADLEERVAELEATTARKGNRKVSLEVSGHVNEAIVFFDAPGERNVYIGTHNSSRSRFRFKGSAQINADWSAGFLMEFGVRANHLSATAQDEPHNPSGTDIRYGPSGIDIRHEALYVKSRTLGTIWLGWTSSATDGITEICLGCGLGNAAAWDDDMAYLLDANGVRFSARGSERGIFTGEGDRREVIRWISPTLAGFVLSAAYGHDDFYDVALRYAGEFGAVRIAGGVGYQRSNDSFDTAGLTCGHDGTLALDIPPFPAVPFDDPHSDCSSFGASASIQHTPTGLYIAGAYGLDKNEAGPGQDPSWHVTGGVNQRFFATGRTNFYGFYTESKRGIGTGAFDTRLRVYGGGIEQSIDAAAMEMYLWYKRLEAHDPFPGEIDSSADVVTVGARIKF